MKVLFKHLKQAVTGNDEVRTRNILMQIGFRVPREVFTWITLINNPSLSLMDLLFYRQLLCDEFISKILTITGESEMTVFDVMEVVVTNMRYNIRNKDVYFIQELLTNENPTSLDKFPTVNIKNNYKDLNSLIEDIVLEAGYFAQPAILENIVKLVSRYNLHFRFQPNSLGKHRCVYEWITNNLNRSGQVGWRDGPDSGKWPSFHRGDYEQTYKLLKQLSVIP